MKKTIITVVASLATVSAMADTPLWMRYAAISPNGEEIAFCYKGDIYKVDVNGGEARRLTTQESYETMPVWSPDGRQIAFASDRFGNLDIFVMQSTGGQAKIFIQNSEVSVNGEICLQRGKKLRRGDIVRMFDDEIEIC